MLSARTSVRWDDYPTVRPADTMKTVLELVHTACGERLCDVQDGDTLEVLADTVADHDAGCAQARAVGLGRADFDDISGLGADKYRPGTTALAAMGTDPRAVRVPAWLYVQTTSDANTVSFAGSSRVPAAAHPLHYGSRRQHQLLVGEMVLRPYYGLGTDALTGMGLGSIISQGYHDLAGLLERGEVLFDPHSLLPSVTR